MREYISAYLKRDFVSSISANEMKSLFQLLRVQNSLSYHMVKLVEAHKMERTILATFQQIEETFIIASVIREAMKELFGAGKALSILQARAKTKSVVEQYTAMETYYGKYKTEPNLLFLDLVRNEFSFHLKKSIYDGNIVEGQTDADMQVSISLSEMNSDIVYVVPVNSAIFQVTQFTKEHGIEKSADSYLFDTVNDEARSLFQFVNIFVADILKGQAFKKKEKF